MSIARFVNGDSDRFDLARIISATRSSPQAMQQLQQQRVARQHADRIAEQRRLAETQPEPGAEQ